MEGSTLGQILHGSATTTEAVRRTIQNRQVKPQGSVTALRHHSKDRRQREEANLGAGFADRAERTKIVGLVACGRSDHRSLSTPYTAAA